MLYKILQYLQYKSKKYQAQGIGSLNSLCGGQFFRFLPFSLRKRSYLKFLLNSKRIFIQYVTHS